MLGKSFLPIGIGYAPRYDCGCCSVRYGETKNNAKVLYRRKMRRLEKQRWSKTWKTEY